MELQKGIAILWSRDRHISPSRLLPIYFIIISYFLEFFLFLYFYLFYLLFIIYYLLFIIYFYFYFYFEQIYLTPPALVIIWRTPTWLLIDRPIIKKKFNINAIMRFMITSLDHDYIIRSWLHHYIDFSLI